jgi:hypothetical protein
MVDRWWGILGRVDDGIAPGQGYRDILSCFGIQVSEFQLTYRRDELIDQVSVWGGKGRGDCLDSLTGTLYIAYTPIYHSLSPTRCDAPPTRLYNMPLPVLLGSNLLERISLYNAF